MGLTSIHLSFEKAKIPKGLTGFKIVMDGNPSGTQPGEAIEDFKLIAQKKADGGPAKMELVFEATSPVNSFC